MIKKIAWNAFKNTGDINSFLEFKQIENIEKQINGETQLKEKVNGNYQENAKINNNEFNLK